MNDDQTTLRDLGISTEVITDIKARWISGDKNTASKRLKEASNDALTLVQVRKLLVRICGEVT